MTSQPHAAASPPRFVTTPRIPSRSPPAPPGPPGAPHSPGHRDTPDHLLLAHWRARGEQQAASELYRRYFDAVYRFFRHKAADEGDATEMVSDTFMRLFHRRASYPEIHTFRDGEPNLRPYLFGIAKRVFYGYLRKRCRSSEIDLLQRALVELVPRTPSSIVFACHKLYALTRALRTLSVHDQMLIEAKYFEEMSERELSFLLEIPTTTVPGRVRSARHHLTEAVHRQLNASRRTTDPLPALDDMLAALGRELRRGADKSPP